MKRIPFGLFHRVAFRGWPSLIVLGGLLTVLLSGCVMRSGNYVIEVYTEMHYQPSYRSQEIPRLLPPDGAVPVTGREIAYDFAEYKTLKVPDKIGASYNNGKASKLFAVNCAMCHGQGGKGDGKVREFLKGFPPANLSQPATQRSTEGEVFGFISHGGRVGFFSAQGGSQSPSPMPTFNRLLTEDERWTLSLYVLRELKGQ